MALLGLEATLFLPIARVPLLSRSPGLYSKGGCARITVLEQLPATMV